MHCYNSRRNPHTKLFIGENKKRTHVAEIAPGSPVTCSLLVYCVNLADAFGDGETFEWENIAFIRALPLLMKRILIVQSSQWHCSTFRCLHSNVCFHFCQSKEINLMNLLCKVKALRMVSIKNGNFNLHPHCQEFSPAPILISTLDFPRGKPKSHAEKIVFNKMFIS